MRDRKRWKGLVALAMSVAMLFSQTVAYAQEGQPVEQMEDTEQAEIVEQAESPCVFYDLYARTESGEPMDGIQILVDYYGEEPFARVYYYSKEGNFNNGNYDGVNQSAGSTWAYTEDGYAKLMWVSTLENGTIYQGFPNNHLGGNVYGIEGYRVDGSLVYKATKDITDKVTVMEGDKKIGDVQFQIKAADDFIASPLQTFEYQVQNLADGWDITVMPSFTTSFVCNPITGEVMEGNGVRGEGGLISITATRKSDERLTPASYEFGGTQDLVFKFDNTLADDIKEVKEVYFAVQDNVQSAEWEWTSGFLIDNYGASYTYDLEKGEVVLKKDALSELIYGAHPSIGNTYIGQMTYIAKDGTEKTVNGDWYIKVLEKGSVTTKPISDCQITLGSTSVTYNGAAQTPAITVKDGSRTLTSGTDYTVAYKDNINVGTAQVTVTGKGSYTGTVTKEFTITNADIAGCTVSLNADSYVYNGTAKTPSVTVKDGTDTLKSGTDYTVTYANNTNAGTARVTVTGRGNYTGTVTKNFTIQKADQKFSYTKSYSKAYGSKAFTLNAKLKAGNGKLTYATSNKKVATVKNGKVTVTGTGAATITVKAARTANYNAASVTVTIKASPAKQTLKSLKAVKGRKLTVTWKKDTRATGYQIQYSTDKNFKKGVKTATVSKYKTVSKTITKLTKGKRYYVRVRSYKSAKVSGKTQKLYGAWSGAKRSGSIKK